MNKETFIKAFGVLVTESDTRLTTIGEIAGVGINTVKKWYIGTSAPANAIRDIVINELQRRAKKHKEKKIFEERVFKYLENNLELNSAKLNDYHNGNNNIYLELKLNSKIISTIYIDIPKECDK